MCSLFFEIMLAAIVLLRQGKGTHFFYRKVEFEKKYLLRLGYFVFKK